MSTDTATVHQLTPTQKGSITRAFNKREQKQLDAGDSKEQAQASAKLAAGAERRRIYKMLDDEVQAEIGEAKRQGTVHVPVNTDMEESGSHSIDHGLTDREELPDTNKYPSEDLVKLQTADLSFWNNSWTWAESENAYGDKPEDKWFINPTPKLIAEVMNNAPTIFSACEVGFLDRHKEQLGIERMRHVDFLQAAYEGDLISESLDLMTAYQSRYFEAVQRYIGLAASYKNQLENANVDEERLEQAQIRKEAAGAQCRSWAAKLQALVEAYHSVVTDERAYRLSFNFSPLPPQDGQSASREFGLFKWSVTNTLNKVGRRLARSIKEGKMDAEKYRIPRPWLVQSKLNAQIETSEMISDFY
jgi:hypothetical protein